MQILNVTIQQKEFEFHPLGAAFWREEGMLLVADVHLGKIAHFRKHGSAVPTIALQENFSKLDRILQDFNVDHLVFLGDLFHSFKNTEWDWFAHWKMKYRLDMTLITGNHDIIDPSTFESLGISVVDEMKRNGFLLTHHPTVSEGYFNMAGHIHPGIALSGMGRQRLKTACFYLTNQQLILPAFGVFTGKYSLQPNKGDRIFALAEEEVIEVSRLFSK